MHAMNVIGGRVVRARRVGLSRSEEQRLRSQLRKQSPSEPWVDAQFIEVTQCDERGNAVVRRMHDQAVFPPGGARTGMVRCLICGIFTPPNTLEAGVCMDHSEPGNWGASPSALAIFKLRCRFRDLEPMELASEEIEDLQAEIRTCQRDEKERAAKKTRRRRGRPARRPSGEE